MITIVYEICGDLSTEQFDTEEQLENWVESNDNKFIVIRGKNHDIEDCT